jgi:asparagine synthase (glutamine-hydrolysing)
MCGICGSIGANPSRSVRRMNAQLVHRGPDDEGIYLDPRGRAALAARRLSIIDVEHGHQPVANEDGTIWAVLNGEIYNHPQLQRELELAGHSLRSRCDTEVLVHLYEEHGPDLVHALEGMYAFAVWDERAGELLLARDRFGEKPLFYREQADALYFGSELSAVRAGAASPVGLDPQSVDAYFILGYVPGEASIVQNIKQLAPGATLQWNLRRRIAEVRRYWRLPPPAESNQRSAAEHAEEFLGLFRRSVRSRLLADVPVGVFLSGGLDSTLVAAAASELRQEAVSTFTVTYDVGEVSEASAAARTARELGTEHHEFELTTDDVCKRVPRLVSRLDQPIADSALVPLNALAEFARHRVKVAVGGEGADELFGGYPRYRWLHRAERWHRAVSPALNERASDLFSRSSGGRLGRVGAMLEPATSVERHLDWVTGSRRRRRARLYGEAMRALISSPAVVLDAERVMSDAQRGGALNRFMTLDQHRYLPGDVLAKADRSTMLASLEMRTPFLDRDLAEFAARIPPDIHVAGGGKAILRHALSSYGLLANRRRRKVAFRTPTAEWLRGSLREQVEDEVLRGKAVTDGWFDRREMERVWCDHLSSRADESSVLWPIVVFGLWLTNER